MEQTLKGKSIFLIEDDPLLQRLLAGKLTELKEKGLEAHIFNNGEDALAQSKGVKTDLVLLDLVLPGMSGFEFLEKFRSDGDHAETTVVVLSNLSADTDREHAKKLGVIAYLVKSNFSMKEISNAIETMLLGGHMDTANTETPDVKETSHGAIIYL